MKIDSLSLDSRLRTAAVLLMCLPATAAAACLAHGHGAMNSDSLLAVLAAVIAIGSIGAYLMLSPLLASKTVVVSSSIPVN